MERLSNLLSSAMRLAKQQQKKNDKNPSLKVDNPPKGV